MSKTSKRHVILEDIHLCKDPRTLLHLFGKLGYTVEDTAIPLLTGELGFSPADALAIERAHIAPIHSFLITQV